MLEHVTSLIYQYSPLPSPACPELKLFSASSALQAAAGAGAVKTGSGLAETSAGLTAPSEEQVVSRVHVAAAAEPKKCWPEGEQNTLAKTERGDETEKY